MRQGAIMDLSIGKAGNSRSGSFPHADANRYGVFSPYPRRPGHATLLASLRVSTLPGRLE